MVSVNDKSLFLCRVFFRDEVHCFMAEEEGKMPDWKGEEEML